VIDKAVHIFTLHFGDKYEFVEELENMKDVLTNRQQLVTSNDRQQGNIK
jgi:hypothetical protein